MPGRNPIPIPLKWPKKGVMLGEPRADQPDETCESARNVETFDQRERRGGGKRRGSIEAFSQSMTGPVVGLAIYRISSSLSAIDGDEDPGPGPAPEVWVGLGVGVNDYVTSMGSFPNSTILIVGGAFSTAGGGAAIRIASWNGTTWSALDVGLNGATALDNVRRFVRAISLGTTYLYVPADSLTAGTNRVSAWNGTAWSAPGSFGSSGTVMCLCLHDDGAGVKLYAGGSFTLAGGVAANRVAVYDPASGLWAAVGTGLNNDVRVLKSFDDGTGPKLYAGGLFTLDGSGAPACPRFGFYNTASGKWEPVGGGIGNGEVLDLVEFMDGAVNKLMVLGSFEGLGASDFTSAHQHITAWNPVTAAFEPCRLGLRNKIQNTGSVNCGLVFDDGSGPALYVVGEFDAASDGEAGIPCPGVAKWDGTDWTAPERGFLEDPLTIKAVGDAFESVLHVGGNFLGSNARAGCGLFKWEGDKYVGWGGGGLSVTVTAAATFWMNTIAYGALASDTAPKFYIAGQMTGGLGAVQYIGFGPTQVSSNIAAYNPATNTWGALGSGTSGDVWKAYVWSTDPTGAALYIAGGSTLTGGALTTVGGVTVRSAAKWNGATWAAVGAASPNNGFNDFSRDIVAHDDGSGAGVLLFYCGFFTTSADGTVSPRTVNRVAKWNPTTAQFVALVDGPDTGLNGDAYCMCEYAGDLIIAGSFTATGTTSAKALAAIARWDGNTNTFNALGAGLTGGGASGSNIPGVSSVAVYNGDLYAAGTFTTAGGGAAAGIAKWNGAAWSNLTGTSGQGINYAGSSNRGGPKLVVHDDGSGSKLWVIGPFSQAGGLACAGVATWDGTNWAVPKETGASINGVGLGDGTTSTSNNGLHAGVSVGGDLYLVGGALLSRVGGGGPAYLARGELAP